MVSDIIEKLLSELDPKTLAVRIPDVFEQLKGQDVNFELATSCVLQRAKLFYRYNVATKKIGYIFVATETSGLKWKDAIKRADIAQKILEEVLEFDEVVVCVDYS